MTGGETMNDVTETWLTTAPKIQRVTAAATNLGPAELEVLALVAETLVEGRAGTPRPLVREAIAEMVDALVMKQPPEHLRAALEESVHGTVYAATRLVALRREA